MLWSHSAQAQRISSTLDLGAVDLRYADTLNARAAAMSETLRFEGVRGSAEASGTFSEFRTGGYSSQGTLSSSVFTPTMHQLTGELAASVGGSAHKDGTRTGDMLANARLHYRLSATGAFAGAGVARTWDGFGWRKLRLGDFGAWARYHTGTAALHISPVAMDDSIMYSDTQLTLGWQSDRVDLDALVGTRAGHIMPSIGTTTKSWGNLSVVAWMTHQLGLVASAGTYPVDPTQGFPGGRFVSLGIRLGSPQRREPTRNESAVAAAPDQLSIDKPAANIDAFRADRSRSGSITLNVHSPSAQSLELTGDFTRWTPVGLERSSGGWWAVTLPIAKGKYQMNLRVDGGKWMVPPGILSMLDEFGGAVGILVVE